MERKDIYQGRISYKNDPNGLLGDIPSITISEYKEILADVVNKIQNGEDVENILIFGAVGIGKRSVPKQFFREYNRNKETKDQIGLISNNYSSYQSYYLSGQQDFPPYWFPSYKPTGLHREDSLLDAKANWHLNDDEQGPSATKSESGGLIVFNEILVPTSDSDILKEHLINIKNRTINGFRLGSKWAIIACSSRPCDSEFAERLYVSLNWEIKQCFTKIYHLTPDPEEWKKWANKQGFEPLILDYIFEPSSEIDGEWPRWHSTYTNTNWVLCNTPHRWGEVLTQIKRRIRRNGLKRGELLKFSRDEIDFEIGDMLDPDVTEELYDWLDKQREIATSDNIEETF